MKVAVTTLVFCVAALLALGMVMLYSSSMFQDGARYLVLQLLWCALGLAICITAILCDYRWLKKGAWPVFLLSILLLMLVFLPHAGGHQSHGARRWLGYGPVRFQPSELAKLGLLLALAWYGEHFQRHMHTFKRGIFLPALFIAPLLALVFVEPDRGATILLAATGGVVLLLAGVQWKFIVPPAGLALAGLGYSLVHDPMRTARILAWLHPKEHLSGAANQAYEAMLALGAGGLTGLGLGNGRQKMGFVPEQHTDFIYSIIGEELGLVATLLVIIAFISLVLSGLYIAWHARDSFGLLLGCGISFLIGFQAFINIGVVTSALPNKGLPLPFISYGGSNLLMMLTCIGILLSIARQARGPEVPGAESAGELRTALFGSRENPFQRSSPSTKATAAELTSFGPLGFELPS